MTANCVMKYNIPIKAILQNCKMHAKMFTIFCKVNKAMAFHFHKDIIVSSMDDPKF